MPRSQRKTARGSDLLSFRDNMTAAQERTITTRLIRTFRRYNGGGPIQKDQRTRDFVFHMTDAYVDLVNLSKLYLDPTVYDQKTWGSWMFAILNHLPAHLMAAARLFEGFVDPFGTVARPKTRKRQSSKRKVGRRPMPK